MNQSSANGKKANASDESSEQARWEDQKKRQEEKRFVETLWNQLGTAAVSEEDAPLLEIVRYMRQTFELFRLRDCGDINQGLQEQICEHLDKLMNQLSFHESDGNTDRKAEEPSDNPFPGNSDDPAQKTSGKNQSPKTDSAEHSSVAEHSSAAEDKPKSESNQKSDQSTPGSPDSRENTQSGDAQTLTPDQWRALQRRFWGELPLELQRSLKQLSDPEYPEEYKPAIDQYFQTLLNTDWN